MQAAQVIVGLEAELREQFGGWFVFHHKRRLVEQSPVLRGQAIKHGFKQPIEARAFRVVHGRTEPTSSPIDATP